MFAPRWFAFRWFPERWFPSVAGTVSEFILDIVARITPHIEISYRDSPDISNLSQVLNINTLLNWKHGFGDDELNQQFSDKRTVSSGGGTDNLTISGRSPILYPIFTDHPVNMEKVRALILENTHVATEVEIGPETGAPFDDWINGSAPTIKVRPGGLFLLLAPKGAGYNVTQTTNDALTVTNNGGSDVDYNVVILGADDD